MEKKKRKNLSFHSKKGNVIADVALVIVFLFAFALIILIGAKLSAELNDDLQSNDFLNNSAKKRFNDFNNTFPDLFDALFILAFILLWGIALVFSYLVESKPVFFFFTMLLILFMGFIGAYLGNGFEELIADDTLSTTATGFPMMTFILTHFLESLLVVAFSCLIVMFGKIRGAI